jgi:insulin receptor
MYFLHRVKAVDCGFISVGADNVDSSKLVVEVLNETLGTVKLRWEEPPSPNGIIVTYQIEYKSIENPNVSPCW